MVQIENENNNNYVFYVVCLFVLKYCGLFLQIYEEMDRKHQFKRKSELASVMREKRRRERRGTSYVIGL